MPRHRHQLVLDGPLQQAPLDLDRRNRREASEGGDRLRLRADPGRMVAEAHVAHLALRDEQVERPHQLLDRREAIPEMDPAEIDAIGLQPPKARFDGPHDRDATRASRVRIAAVHAAAELGRDHGAVAARLAAGREPLADDPLGVALGVDVGGVDEVAAALGVEIELPEAPRLVGAEAPLLAEGHRAEAERADAKPRVPERAVVREQHGRLRRTRGILRKRWWGPKAWIGNEFALP
jgi:hypothetical protein